ncbi:MAG: endonuclease [Halobacteriovoraceae bacterium]|nr:endonuclease [Halobacteriovoraceae bacterium]MCB9093602.1 endonuclease [Halobacteriovoraceae bacterium]
MKFALLSLLIFVSSSFAQSRSTPIFYYGKDFYRKKMDTDRPLINRKDARLLLNKILDSIHEKKNNTYDGIGNCQKNCYEQVVLDYISEVRPLVMAELHSEEVMNKRTHRISRIVHTPYCNLQYTVNRNRRNGEYQLPDPKDFNVEHTFPKSRFNSHYSYDMQVADLHNLWPVMSRVNTLRGNASFKEIPGESSAISFCKPSEYGKVSGSEYFEPPNNHKGQVARAMLYFVVRYEIDLDSREASQYVDWNKTYPVTEEEKKFNDDVYKHQKTRNPFIDFPLLVDYLSKEF